MHTLVMFLQNPLPIKPLRADPAVECFFIFPASQSLVLLKVVHPTVAVAATSASVSARLANRSVSPFRDGLDFSSTPAFPRSCNSKRIQYSIRTADKSHPSGNKTQKFADVRRPVTDTVPVLVLCGVQPRELYR